MHNNQYIPPGIWYETAKDRWRVRLYKNNVVVFRSYFKTFEEALAAYYDAKGIQKNTIVTNIEDVRLEANDINSMLNVLQM
jgi:hypothetical protein